MKGDLNSSRGKVVLRRKAVKDTRERWFGTETVASSAVGEAAPRTIFRISDVAVGDVQYVEEHNKLGLPWCSQSLTSPGKSEKKLVPVSPVLAKNSSLLKVRLLAILHLKLPSRKFLRSRAQEKVVAIVAMPPLSRGDIYNNLIVYMYRLLAFVAY